MESRLLKCLPSFATVHLLSEGQSTMKIELTPIQVLNLLSIAKAEKLAEERNIEKLKKSYPNDEISSEWLEDISSIVESLHNSYSQFLNEE